MDWSSGESESDSPVEDRSNEFDEVNTSETNSEYQDISEMSFDLFYYPSIKIFIGPSGIYENISISGEKPLDFFNFFFQLSYVEFDC